MQMNFTHSHALRQQLDAYAMSAASARPLALNLTSTLITTVSCCLPPRLSGVRNINAHHVVHSKMDCFALLPIDLLPNILEEIIRPAHLASVCLVNSTFHAFGIQILYRRVFIYSWHKEAKAKVINVVHFRRSAR